MKRDYTLSLQKIISFIEKNGCVNVVSISKEFRIPLKEVFKIINKIKRVKDIKIVPAYCRKCGFKLKLGSTKCPRCKSMWIEREKICIK